MWKVEISFIQFDHIFFIKSDRKRIAQIVHIIVERNRCDINELGNKNIDENVPGLLKICIQ